MPSEDATFKDTADLAKKLIDWIDQPENYSMVEFAISYGISKEELFRLAGEDSELSKALDYGFSVQEYKVSDGAITGVLDKNVALKMLETYNGWKGEVNILQKNEYKQFMNEAKKKAEMILNRNSFESDEHAVKEDDDI